MRVAPAGGTARPRREQHQPANRERADRPTIGIARRGHAEQVRDDRRTAPPDAIDESAGEQRGRDQRDAADRR